MNKELFVLRMNRRAACAALIASAAVLSACGGGGNESGPPDSITASPASVGVLGPLNSCFTGLGPTVYIYGGQPPYKLSNSLPQSMQIDKQVVSASGQGFTITFNGDCMTGMPITIEDGMGRVLAVPVTNDKGS